MYRMHTQDQTPDDVVVRTIGNTRVACFFAALGFAAALLLGSIPTAGGTHESQPPSAAAPTAPADPSRFMLNALLVPALDGDAMPLRWVDPRPVLQCGPNSAVRVNRKPLVAGAMVPDAPFELEWLTDGCRPFGANGVRFDGVVKLTVFREDWGFSAMVETAGLRVTSAENATILVRPYAAAMPQSGEPDEPVVLTAANAHR